MKVSNFCSNNARQEERRSQYALCYNVVHESNELTKKNMITKKDAKGQAYKNNNKIEPRGKLKLESILIVVKLRHDKIMSSLDGNPDEMRPIYDEMKNVVGIGTGLSFQAERQQEQFEKNNNSTSRRRRRTNVVVEEKEEEEQPDFTPQIKNEVPFGKLRKNHHIEGLRLELIARGVSQDEVGTLRIFSALKKKLISMVAEEKGVDKKAIKSFEMKSNFNWASIFRT